MNMHWIILFIFISLIPVPAWSQSDHGGLSILLEVRGGTFNPNIKNFNKVYPERRFSPLAAVGVGFNKTFLVGRYQLFNTSGQSLIDGAELTGKAQWEEEFYSVGLRTYEGKPFYFELAYVVGSVKESIWTKNNLYPALNNNFSSKKNGGLGVAVGLNFPLIMGFHFSGEINYLFIKLKSAGDEKSNKQMGGMGLNIGAGFFLK